jgi:hypothetical protein
VFSLLAYSVESSLSGAKDGRKGPRWVIGIEMAIEDGCLLKTAGGCEKAGRCFDHQPHDLPVPNVVEPDDGIATDLGGIRAAQGDGGKGKSRQVETLGKQVSDASGEDHAFVGGGEGAFGVPGILCVEGTQGAVAGRVARESGSADPSRPFGEPVDKSGNRAAVVGERVLDESLTGLPLVKWVRERRLDPGEVLCGVGGRFASTRGEVGIDEKPPTSGGVGVIRPGRSTNAPLGERDGGLVVAAFTAAQAANA